MTSRRSFLKALGLGLGSLTIASKAVSAILSLPENKNELQRVVQRKNVALVAQQEYWYDDHGFRINPWETA